MGDLHEAFLRAKELEREQEFDRRSLRHRILFPLRLLARPAETKCQDCSATPCECPREKKDSTK
jgi:hypothetical protein